MFKDNAQVLFLVGLYFFIGITGIIKFFTKKGKIQGSGVYFIGLVLIVLQFTFVGTLVQLIGLFIIFRSFLPDFYDYICRLPVVGSYLSKYILYSQKVTKYKALLISQLVILIIAYDVISGKLMINDRFLYIGDLFVIYYNLWIRKRTRIIHPSRLYILTY